MAQSDRVKYQYILAFLVDAIALVVSGIATWLLLTRVISRIPVYSSSGLLQFIWITIGAFLVAFVCFDQTENITRRSWKKELVLSAKFNVILLAAMVMLMVASRAEMLSNRTLIFGLPIMNTVLVFLGHEYLKYLLIHSKALPHYVGIISTKERAPALIEDIRKDWTKKIRGVGLLDAENETIGSRFMGERLSAIGENFVEWVLRDALDEVYISIPGDSGDSIIPYLQELESMGVDIHMNVPLLEKLNTNNGWLAHLTPIIESRGGTPMVSLKTNERTITEMVLKRGMDLVGGTVGLILSIPIILIVAIPLKLESPGPLFFKQKRVGLNGRYFYMYKIRSMYQDAEERKKELMAQNEMNGLMFKMADDPRITKVGKFIRKTSIDEFPQFFNVVMGSMSLVGTRPPTLDEYEKYESHHKRRLSMKPGITGLWQVSGRSDIEDFEDVVRLDVEYIDNWSFWSDIKILFKTVAVVFRHRGAR